MKAWQQAMTLVTMVYSATSKFPGHEQFGLTSQLRRAAVSVPANIAEGFARNGTKELLHFLGIASGSLAELDTLVELAQKLGYLDQREEMQRQVDDVSGLVMGLAASIRRKL
ncbi:MAG: four helix bundle protein [Methylobacterium sp.]|nr:four helix bundle protein [Methylobacterium sp.]